jgi:KaiC
MNYLIRGGSAAERTAIAMRYALQERSILITDQKPANVDERVTILNASSRYFTLVESPADIIAIVDELSDYVKRVGARRIVIDPIYTLVNTTYVAYFAKTIAETLLNALDKLPVTTVVTADDRAPELLQFLEQRAKRIIDASSSAPLRKGQESDSRAARARRGGPSRASRRPRFSDRAPTPEQTTR